MWHIILKIFQNSSTSGDSCTHANALSKMTRFPVIFHFFFNAFALTREEFEKEYRPTKVNN
jgi:hypothetical protein